MSLRIINARHHTDYKRGTYVEVERKGIGQITKSDDQGYIYVRIFDKDKSIKVWPPKLKKYIGHVGAKYEI